MIERNTLTKLKFSEICERIKEIINTFFEEEDICYSFLDDNDRKKIRLDERKTMLFLSNGDVVNYTINKKNLAHLLGINTDYLLATGMYSENNSYDILKKFVISDSVSYKKHTDGIIDLNRVLSPYIEEKLNSFEKNAFININDCQFVCKYDKNRAYGFYDTTSTMDYIVVQQSEGMYYISILSEDDKGNYLPVSNQVFNSYEEFYNKVFPIITNQEITLINGMSIKQGYSFPKKLWVNVQARNSKLETLAKNARDFECIPNVLNDYLYSQKIISDNRMDNNVNNALFIKIASLMETKNVINLNKLGFSSEDISPEMHNLINAYNNSLFEDNGFDENKLFTDVQEENETLKKEIKAAQEKIDELNAKYNLIEEQYKDKEAELENLNKKIEEIRKVLG